MLYESSNRAQGTIEYLVIIGIVVVISLVVVGVLVSQTGSATEVSAASSKISSLVGEISLVDSGVTPDGNYLVVLKSNIVGAITITNVKVGDYNRNFSEQLNQGSSQNFIVFGPTCSLGEKKSLNVSVIYSDQYGLAHTQVYPSSVGFICEGYEIRDNATPGVIPPVVPPVVGGDSIVPTVFLQSPANNLSFNGLVDFNFLASDNNAILSCVLRIDGVDRNIWSTIDTNHFNVLKFNISTLTEGMHTWDVNCLDYNSNWGTYGGTDWSIAYDIVNGRNVYFSSANDFNFGNYSTFATNFGSIKPQGEMDWNINDGTTRIDGLIAQWKLNDNAASTTVVESLGGYNGTAYRNTSAVYTSTAKINGAMTFDGTNDYVNTSLVLPTTGSISLWYKASNTTGDRRMIGGEDSSVGSHGVAILVNQGGSLYAVFRNNGVSGDISSGSAASTSSFEHVVLVWGAGGTKFYRNNLLVGSSSAITSISNGGLSFKLGAPASGSAGKYSGSLDDVRIYNKVLSTAEIAALYNSGNGTEEDGRGNWTDQNLVAYYKFDSKNGTTIFDSAKANHGALTNGADTNAQGLWDTNAGYFDGVNDTVLVPYSKMDPNGTIELWFKPKNNLDSTSTLSTLFDKVASGNDFALFQNIASDGKLGFRNQQSGTQYFAYSTTNKFYANQWYHVAVTWGALGTKIYLNGVQEGSNAFTGIPSGNTGNYYIASYTNGTGNYFGGSIEEFKIYNRALNSTEIQSDYNRGLFDSNYISRIIDTNSGYMGPNGTDYNYLILNKNNGTDMNGHIYGTQIEPTVEKDLNNGLVGLWHLNSNGSSVDLNDSSSKGNVGSCVGSVCPTKTTGLWGTNAASFDALDDYISIPNSSSLNLTSTFSVSFWAQLNADVTGSNLGGVLAKDNSNDAWGFQFHGSGFGSGVGNEMSFHTFTTSGGYQTWAKYSLPKGIMTHYVGVYDGSTNKLYINGDLKDKVSVAGTLLTNTNALEIGRDAHYTNRKFNGLVEDIAIWNRVLDASEVKELFNKGAAKIGLKYRSCESSSTCSRSWSDINYPTTTNQISLNMLDGNQFMQYSLYPSLYQFPDGNYLPQAFATVRDVNVVYTN